jgi:CRP-like cAMP-binding protein
MSDAYVDDQDVADDADAGGPPDDLGFEDISPQERERLLGRHGRQFPAGTLVFREGEPAAESFLLQQGRIRLIKRVGISDRSLAVLREGDLFGEGALTRGATYGCTAATLTEVVALAVDRDTFHGLLIQYPGIALRVIDQLVRRVRDAEDQVEIMMVRGVQSKVTTALLKLAASDGAASGSGTGIIISPVELSTRIGLDVESVKTAVQRLRDRGYLRIAGEKIEIPDVEALRQLQTLFATKDGLAGGSGPPSI